jgi:hypothetical protein
MAVVGASGVRRRTLRRWSARRSDGGLFHVQEHPATLTEIERFLQENKLAFLGFDISADVVQAYRARFPGDRAATNLAQWQLFENENPDTFVGMYQFWVQKSR